eukprot:9585775-Karenia_brevis.AAC.1
MLHIPGLTDGGVVSDSLVKHVEGIAIHLEVFLSDNGYKLEEHNRWAKNPLFYPGRRVPMMLHIPGLTDGGV